MNIEAKMEMNALLMRVAPKLEVKVSAPKPDAYESGGGVAWAYYKKESDAKEAQRTARYLGEKKFMSNDKLRFSTIKSPVYVKEGSYRGMWRVCIPA